MYNISEFHAHVYFEPDQQPAAERLRQGLARRFPVRLGRWFFRPYGPHPKAMYQVAFAPDQLGSLLPWLMLNRRGLDILVHPETGHDVLDHTENAMWLGQPLPLSLTFFDSLSA